MQETFGLIASLEKKDCGIATTIAILILLSAPATGDSEDLVMLMSWNTNHSAVTNIPWCSWTKC